ncbi:pyridoxal-dependent decarboxylase domain protein [Necator americanus]|uniref:Pyridoxal-dependent decarboxylase domain protein n=1 Tax=Necator americanus TaxID=51031 RepID=W2T087_NECAM|nr:pyridoxal-dependent decarboxylase domain protein [Necator americanus]ETN74671.1 pyridoxal-dependent decarboxylase domain protein [Necator americanus]
MIHLSASFCNLTMFLGQPSVSSTPTMIPSPPSMPSNNTAETPIEDPVPMPEGNKGMSRAQFRRYGKETVDYIADYLETIHKRRVVPAIEPGYLKNLIPAEAPTRAESWETVMEDFEKLIMPGVTHWQHPRFHAYFPAGNSYPSILADMINDALGCVGFSWAACPAMTELEMIMLNWFGKMIGLPKEFLPLTEGGKGGGVIQGSASECNFVSLLAARFEVMKELRQRFPFVEEGLLLSKLIAYCSKEAHSSVEKACMIGMVKLRILETDSKFRLRGEILRNAIQVPASLNDRFVIRFCVCAENATDQDIETAYAIISQTAQHILHEGTSLPIVEDAEAEHLEEAGYDVELAPVSNVTVVDETNDAPFNEGQLTKEELIAKKQKESLAKRRSFLVRMVSDPKCYNPKIVRHLNMANHRKMSQDLYRDRTLMQVLLGSVKKIAQLFCTSSGKLSPIASVPVGCLSRLDQAALVSYLL